MKELKEAIGEFDIAHIFLLLTTVCGSATSVFLVLFRRFSKYSNMLKKAGSYLSPPKNETKKVTEPLSEPQSTPLTEPLADPPLLCSAPPLYAGATEQHRPASGNCTSPHCAPPSSNRISYTLMREKLGKVHCTQYSIKRWEYPLPRDAERSCEHDTKTNFTRQ